MGSTSSNLEARIREHIRSVLRKLSGHQRASQEAQQEEASSAGKCVQVDGEKQST